MADASKPKRPSGSQNRKRKAEKEKESAKLKRSLLVFLQREDKENTDILTETSECSTSTTEQGTEAVHGENLKDEGTSNTSAYVSIDYDDPGTWPDSINDHLRQMIVSRGPQQNIPSQFPKDKNNRRFTTVHFNRQMCNGEKIPRKWLVYSPSNNTVVCFCCKLFKKKQKSAYTSLCREGSNDWKNMSTILSSHERNVNHIDNCQVWRELEVRLRENKTIDAMHQKKIKQQESYWKQILHRLIALVRTLGGQNLAFRGSKDKLYDHNNGNYLKFIEYLALFDPVMNEHLQKVKDAKLFVHYLGKDIQNELIQLLSRAIRAKILNSAKLAKYYSIILDCTPDISHTEQMTIIIRFVDVMDEETQQPDVVIREHFLGFVPLQETTGAFISKTIVDELEQMGLQIDNLRGQGYDNGSNMKGKINGVQRKIIEKNLRAFFVPCNAHSLNLVVNDCRGYNFF
nr:zinc finger MYM-type protein 1-like [Onthophagus taurus]XP_022911221.1 zinc finger MYM-type protein 1-like [Onthophagus taurus]XP_022911222.1 zinc finger MYM-type protein 1-like [Onthophagus taurus]XP_022911223.1 zinc finger MYM-type protein 1-like [Onthophagus taurus]